MLNPSAATPGIPMPLQTTPLLDPEHAWRLVTQRDPAADGTFVYAVSSTGIFCRPSCPSRRPSRRHVLFFPDPAQAAAAGFRACLRCRPDRFEHDRQASARLLSAICAYLREHIDRAVTLGELSRSFHQPGERLQRLFKHALGLSPRQFQLQLRATSFRERLSQPPRSSESASPPAITEALYEAGYSGASRLYAHSNTFLGMKPSVFREGGRGEQIRFRSSPCVLGHVLVAATHRGICWVALGDDPGQLQAGMEAHFRHATLHPDSSSPNAGEPLLATALTIVLSQLSARPLSSDLPLDLRATVFQQRVWHALRAVPRGQTRSYTQIAAAIGKPTAQRAVARACATNPIALLIPCHRVLAANGRPAGYRWGKARKERLLALEASPHLPREES